jgi:hypothetical protein
LIEIGMLVQEKIFKIYQCIFAIILPWKDALHFNNINSLYPRNMCAKFGANLPSGSGEDENLKSLQTDRQWLIRKAHLSFQL